MRTTSKNPKKQRKYQFNTPKNEIHKLMSANLSADLRAKKGFRSLPLRVGDTVSIVRGAMKGRSGKINHMDRSKKRVFVDKVVKRKTDNTEIPVPIHPSNLVITKYLEKDRKRLELINRRIKNVDEKLDIDEILANVEEDEDIIEIDDGDIKEDLEEEEEVVLSEDEAENDEDTEEEDVE